MIFSQCTEIIKCLPALRVDRVRLTDCDTEPHEITHAPDALRGFAIFYTSPSKAETSAKRTPWTSDMWEDFFSAGEDEKNYLKRKYGEPI